jgi:feruloyl esterase
MTTRILWTGAAALALSAGGALADALDCAELTPEALGLEGVAFAGVEALPAAGELGVAACRVRGRMAERTGADGAAYALSFELNLPETWNGRYVHQFNGGNDGVVKPATGAMAAGTGAESPLARGFAVVSSDAGHDGAAFPEAGLAGSNRFGWDFEARRMYGYGAVAALDPVARQIVERFYGRPIDFAYGIGCSNGGRHAMVAAERMPEAFDGIIAGAPGYHLPRAALQHAWDVQHLKPLTGDIRTSFSREDMAAVGQEIRAACDKLDGIEDGLVADTAACQAAFDPKALEGRLTAAQVEALTAIMDGARDADGTPLYSDWVWDPGMEASDWRGWKIESAVEPWDHRPIIAVMGAGSLAQVFTVPPTEITGDPDALEAFLLGFDLDAKADRIDATSPEFPESPMQLMAPPHSDDPTLAAFRDAGGKLILMHGVADPVFSVEDTARYFQRLDANNGGAAAEFARFYPVPGMNHCDGGPATDAFDLLAPLMAWVEQGEAPGAILASAREDNEELPEGLRGASRPLCPAPQVARYQGGDPKAAASFACE